MAIPVAAIFIGLASLLGLLVEGTIFAVIWAIRAAWYMAMPVCWLAVPAVRLASKGAGALSERLTVGD